MRFFHDRLPIANDDPDLFEYLAMVYDFQKGFYHISHQREPNFPTARQRTSEWERQAFGMGCFQTQLLTYFGV